jgi:hypothetical protein
MADKNVTTASFGFKLDGESEIEITTLTNALNALNELVTETASSCYPGSECQLKAVATKQGSFYIDLSVVAATLDSLFTRDNITIAFGLVACIKTMLDIKAHIKNKEPKKVEKKENALEVKNSEGATKKFNIDASAFFSNCNIEKAIVNFINAADANPEVTGISIYTKDDASVVRIPRSDFTDMNEPIIENMVRNSVSSESVEVLYVKQPDFLGKSQWVFMRDRRIPANILDYVWLAKYQARQIPPLVPGSQMRVRLLAKLQLGEDGMPIPNHVSYDVLEVLDVIDPEPSNQFRL